MHTLKMHFLHFQILIPQLKWICTLQSSPKLSLRVSKHQYLLPNLAHIIKDGGPKKLFLLRKKYTHLRNQSQRHQRNGNRSNASLYLAAQATKQEYFLALRKQKKAALGRVLRRARKYMEYLSLYKQQFQLSQFCSSFRNCKPHQLQKPPQTPKFPKDFLTEFFPPLSAYPPIPVLPPGKSTKSTPNVTTIG